jgi:hypothetical protein
VLASCFHVSVLLFYWSQSHGVPNWRTKLKTDN